VSMDDLPQQPDETQQSRKGRPMETIGVLLVVVGLALAAAGVVMVVVGRLGGDLPGDIHIQTGSVTIYSPCLTMLIISIVGSVLLTLILNVITRLLGR
jgi:hypothetical protein